MNRLLFGLVIASLAVLPGCREKDGPLEGGSNGTPASVPTAEVANFEDRLLEIARTYTSFRRLGDVGNWAPLRCSFVDIPHLSTSHDEATHGQKIYWLFVKHVPTDAIDGYIPPTGLSPVGQVAVKEAWVPKEAKDVAKVRAAVQRGLVKGLPVPYIRKGNRFYHAREKLGLFIMYKLDPSTPGTDNGWVYGTVTADGKKVMSSGRVESCMSCHQDAPHDRLFGEKQRDDH